MKVFPSSHARRVPWKNGRGSTLELLTDASEPGGAWTWRLAVADVPEEGPFSPYPNIDRSIVVLEGRGLELDGPEGRRDVPRQGEGLAFAGEEPITGHPLGTGVQDGNLMLQRGQWRGAVLHLVRGRHVLEGDVVLLHAWSGSLEAEDVQGRGVTLAQGETLEASGVVHLDCSTTGRALVARLTRA
jgi:environmental stress-induced protein Ves